jgi:hypothetical protein
VPPHTNLHYLNVGLVTCSTLSRVTFKVGLRLFYNAYSGTSIHRGERFKPTKPGSYIHKGKGVGKEYKGGQFYAQRGPVLGNKGAILGDGSTTKPGGITKVAMLGFNLA